MADYPPPGFHFSVSFDISGRTDDSRFQEVTGLEVEMEMESFAEGGQNRFTWQLPKRARYQDITLKRGMLTNSEIISWCKNAFEQFIFEPTNVIISLLNEEHVPLQSWQVIHAIPKKWTVSSFNAMENSVVIESITLSYQYFNVIQQD